MSSYIKSLSVLLASKVPGSNIDLFNWIIISKEHNILDEKLKANLLEQGWDKEVVEACFKALNDSLNLVKTNKVGDTSSLMSTAGMGDNGKINLAPWMPGFSFDDYPNRIDVGDKTVDILLSINHPRVIMFDNFLSDEECDALVAHSTPKLEESLTINKNDDGTYESKKHYSRTSSGTFLMEKSELIQVVDNRISKLLNWDLKKMEDLHILRYLPGQEYKPHHDFFNRAYVESEREKRGWGQRVGTLLLYLNEVEAGGYTIFPETGINIHPKKGCAMFFAYEDNRNSLSLHGGAPVVKGVKWVATKWIRERD